MRAVVESDAPREVVEAALFKLSTLRSPTVFQTADGEYYGWEGVGDRTGSCYGTCTHVWGYEFATSLLFAPIARSLRRIQFGRCTDDVGLDELPGRAAAAEHSRTWDLAAADGQIGLSRAPLPGLEALRRRRRCWPTLAGGAARRWSSAGSPAAGTPTGDGVMEGVQHNTMDVEYYGPNPQMRVWYLAALRACAEMAASPG